MMRRRRKRKIGQKNFSLVNKFLDTVKFVKWEFKFLDIFHKLQSFTNEPNMLDVTLKVQTLFEDALVDFSEFHLAEYFDFCTFKVQHKIWLTKMEIRSKYSFPKITSLPLSANKDGSATPKFVAEFFKTVIDNLRDLVDDSCSLLYVPETKEHIKDVLKEMKLLHNFVCFVSDQIFIEPRISQHLLNFFTHVLAVGGHASMLASWCFSGRAYEDQDSALGEINLLLFLQMKLKPIQPSIRKIYIAVLQDLKSTIQSGWCPNIQNEHAANSAHLDLGADFLVTVLHNLMELPTSSSSSGQRVPLKDHLAFLQDILNFLRADIIHVPTQDVELLRCIDTLIVEVGLLVYSLYKGEEEDMELGEVNGAQVLDLSGNIQHMISTVIYPTIRKGFQSNLPRIHGLGYADFLLYNLNEFQSCHADSLTSVKNQLQIIQKQLESMQPFLEAVAQERHHQLKKIKRCATQLIDKACEVEYLVDACISKEGPVWCLEHWLFDIAEEITLIKAEVAEIQEKKIVEEAMIAGTFPAPSNSARSPMMNEEIVGFEEVIEMLRDKLTKGTKGRDVISIVGMPGLGKTTLANRLYFDRLVVSHFDFRAQYCVSRVYSRKELLLAILCEAISEDYSERRENLTDDELADKLRKVLFSRRYLILIDDVWEASVWDDLRSCFHDANNGSRIMLTTRDHEVANYARFQSEPLPLRMFREDESWELLRKKVFGKETCSPLLMNIGKRIAKGCGQLPLSVALIAGILVDTEKKEECWKHVANNLSAYIHNGSRAIIEHSYQSLPYHLRPCLLYFGAFLEDDLIDVLRLKMLWISEGFVKSCEGKNLKDVAEDYLENLIGRNLVMGTKRSYGGKIKVCRIHDLLHDFCKVRAKEENFLRCKKRDENDDHSSPLYCHKQLAHRLSINGVGGRIREWIREWSPCWSHVCSILFRDRPYLSYEYVSKNLHRFKFLKVLDFGSTEIDSFPTGLVYLRYFVAKCEAWSISSFLDNRQNLETLIVDNSVNLSLPSKFWKMVKLRHLNIENCEFTKNKKGLLGNSNLYDLQTLSTPTFYRVKDMEWILGKAPNLRELSCHVYGVSNFSGYVLNFPTHIEELKIVRYLLSSFRKIPFCIAAPNLKVLTLYGFSLHPQHLSAIGSLSNLQELELQEVKFVNSEWNVSNDEFPQLKVLKIQPGEDSFKKWSVADDAFPNLECLVLEECQHLKEIPSCFAEISSLIYIQVKFCNKFVEASARAIQEIQVENYQNYGFEISIQKQSKENKQEKESKKNLAYCKMVLMRRARAIRKNRKLCAEMIFVPNSCSFSLL